MKRITTSQFLLDDLRWFADISGDWNPIHVDPVAARRLVTGEAVVHGMYAVLWALDAYCAFSASTPRKIKASFHKPIRIKQPVTLLLEEEPESDAVRLVISCNEVELVSILVSIGGSKIADIPLQEYSGKVIPLDIAFPDLKGLSGEMPVMGCYHEISKAFPSLVEALGILPTTTFLTYSRLVGMECPGLHSLFSAIDIELRPLDVAENISWKVIRHTISQAPLRISVSGGGLSGYLDSFVRPSPVRQPSAEIISSKVRAGSFKEQIALIIGGSRGLGELTAKIIAAGGGETIITYMCGVMDAEHVQQDIIKNGEDCRIIQMDVTHPENALNELLKESVYPTHVYYFASPRISRTKTGLFDSSLYEEMSQIYVVAFSKLLTLLSSNSDQDLRVFYPSTVFIDERPPEHGEYISAKSAGEALSKHIHQHMPGVSVLSLRLPMLSTDQTAGLLRKSLADPTDEMLKVVNQLEHLDKKEDIL